MTERAGAQTPDEPSAESDDWHALGIGIIALDPDMRVIRCNEAALSMLGQDQGPLVGHRIDSLVDPVDHGPLIECLVSATTTGTEQSIRLPPLPPRSELLLRARPHRDTEILVSVQDVGDVMASDRLSQAMRAVLDTSNGFVGIADDRANVIYLNERAQQTLGLTSQDFGALRLTDVLHAETFNRYYEEIRPTVVAHGKWSGLVRLASDDESDEMWGTVFGGVGPGGATIEWLAAVTGAEADRAETIELAYRANHDHLTGLANRSLFLDRLRLALLRRDRAHHPVTVAFLDLDGFKAVNDSAGHQIGDELLRLVSERLSGLMRPTDTVARWGGDEFVVLCEDASGQDGFGQRLAAGLKGAAFDVKGTEFRLGATVGTATSPPGPSTAEELVAAADADMYRSKRSAESG